EQHQAMLDQHYTGAAADQAARAAVITQVARDTETQEQMDAYILTMTKEEAQEYARQVRERTTNPAIVGRGGGTIASGFWTDSESVSPMPTQVGVPTPSTPVPSQEGEEVPLRVDVPLPSTVPTPWDQPMEVEQLPEKPPSPPATPPRRTPEFKVPQHTAPRRVASGSGFAGWGPGRSVIAGEGWKPVRPTRSLIYGTEMQTNLRVRENRKLKMREGKDRN
ncbi:MAG: hypothetical protein GY820_46205, partial [Gammaproteobacteria bacterium]|nr:hypothetical protein [Gammaproteobacteria bacterium]